MNKRYDIIRMDKGGPMWEGAADSFEDARQRAEQCVVEYSCECWIVDLNAGTKDIIKRDGSVHSASM
jgi:hypothetical protein